MRWFGHVQRRNSEYITGRMLKMQLPCRRQREISNRTFVDVLRKHMQIIGEGEIIQSTGEMEDDGSLW